MPKVSVIVPTYCEADNLPLLVPRIHEAATSNGIDAEIIIVDDNSSDETPQVCRTLQESFPVRLIVRTGERGLSSAVIAGMRAAHGDVLLVMDADLSHPPEKIPELVSALNDPETDFVIGSRYVTGSSTAEDWGLLRWVNSRAATWLARPFTSAKDPMAGFFSLRRSAFQSAEETLNPIGYKIGLELIVKCGCKKVVEVPIHFADRLHGQSKLSIREQIHYLWHLKRLFDHQYRDWAYFVQFAMVGGSGMVVDLSCFGLFLVVFSTEVARGLAIWTAMTWNFTLNRLMTFSYARHGSLPRQYFGYCASCLMGALVNWKTSVELCALHTFFERHKLVAAVVGVLGGMIFNYVLCRHFVFRAQRVQKGGADSEGNLTGQSLVENGQPPRTEANNVK